MKRMLSIIAYLLFSLVTIAQKTERFADSLNVIKDRKYKIIVTQDNYNIDRPEVKFWLYGRSREEWKLLQSYKFLKGSNIYLDVILDEDLNNDGYGDLKISYASAARGANEICKLFIFNPTKQNFTDVINSQNYPNLHYNPKRNCINAYMFHGGSTTCFLRLQRNKLNEFATVQYWGDTVASYKIVNGKSVLLKKIKYKTDGAAPFFSDYNPIRE